MTKKLWFQIGIGISLALIIIRLFIEVKDIFSPLVVIGQTIFLPLLLGGVLFYLTKPALKFFESKKVPKWTSILAIFIVLGLIVWLFTAMISPMITKQINALAQDAPELMQGFEDMVDFIVDQKKHLPLFVEQPIDNLTSRVNDMAQGFGTWMIGIIQSFLRGVFLLVLVPFFLLYLLKDHEKFAPFVASFFRGERKTWIRKTLVDIDITLRSYIQGQLIVSFAVGVMLLIGYLIIGLEYALLLATFGLMMNVIPFIGPFISVIPALIIGFIQEPEKAIYVAIIMLVAQQIESNLISPNVMGKVLDIHPLTIITIILAAGNIAGFWGIILAVPTYAVIKVIMKNVYARGSEIKEAANATVEEE
ncbi:AI-2E family transporter [Paenisporosarcina sp. TG20]|uniref:AI-2E family transporter n=1 Tax=Paenisporosarcina sp. TG20 TaxID=1211706 RepID=UPI0002D686C0|nr:AI-2E family transporter [Paenisporosarcina sp. TG20]